MPLNNCRCHLQFTEYGKWKLKVVVKRNADSAIRCCHTKTLFVFGVQQECSSRLLGWCWNTNNSGKRQLKIAISSMDVHLTYKSFRALRAHNCAIGWVTKHVQTSWNLFKDWLVHWLLDCFSLLHGGYTFIRENGILPYCSYKNLSGFCRIRWNYWELHFYIYLYFEMLRSKEEHCNKYLNMCAFSTAMENQYMEGENFLF